MKRWPRPSRPVGAGDEQAVRMGRRLVKDVRHWLSAARGAGHRHPVGRHTDESAPASARSERFPETSHRSRWRCPRPNGRSNTGVSLAADGGTKIGGPYLRGKGEIVVAQTCQIILGFGKARKPIREN